eukprot:TRINITY_DN93504_c0_g1_i1.p1 TRINITY_DN93504_c0_g1~~TRINITY_DN93504_c0_g1_i1.p1  ORF type:complete len:138 (+),score=22.60 TRINITY_DN93504_c0_g1_i1:136-549(+)
MLNNNNLNLMQMNEKMNNFSSKKRTPVYTISKTERFPGLSRSYSVPEPGKYRLDCSLPANEQTEILASRITRALKAPKFSFPRENRMAPDDYLKGISPMYAKDTNHLGPGQYPVPKMGNKVNKQTAPMYSVPRAIYY